ncbi:SGNH/GDSL hydrolase family protein [Pseudomonas sp. CCC3.2]|uniref:SGNH/GDSL hydrolase family protein n=1 Tax=unclassified Pseudomonas TaxID=196821 RepID=UPI002AB4C9A8|nr:MULTISPECIES: SGNH/GDSL hydrolase family protein [unclassified Pseudomonas]MDY7559980.1 SGNH/GDSL hydrolase family protein [Pseudomonas sp. AB6]MEB0179380.1 SGNH/GDSL hydrolase family protein [Pseudomonas sp. CCC3.2]MEB0210446.1 SGNH/GDSL hydrolase family protein [Pseudomonas sp. AB6]
MRYVSFLFVLAVLVLGGCWLYPSHSAKDGSLKAYKAAIRDGHARIVFLGDSIEEGTSQIVYSQSWVKLISADLRKISPGIEIYNLSLPGRGIGNAIDSKYKAVPYVGFSKTDYAEVGFARPKATDNSDVWPYGTILGETWIDHVKSLSPDLVVIGFGMNDIGGSVLDIKTLTEKLISELSSSSKSPSIALVTPILPTTTVEPYSKLQENVERTAEAYTDIAKETGATLIDANRRYIILRDGVDIRSKKNSSLNFVSYPSGYAKEYEPKYTELQLLGPGEGGGNGINHPTAIGHKEVYAAEAKVLVDATDQSLNRK